MNIRPLRLAFLELFVFSVPILSGCAARQETDQQQVSTYEEEFNDPFEETNRKIFNFNQLVDRNVLVPVAKTYRTALPDPVRDSFRDFLNNLREPLVFVNDSLQGQFDRAAKTVGRFVVNSTVGIGGLVDVAGRWGIPYHEEDLGLTLGAWGVPEGPYIVVPVLGPSSPRDLGGQVVEGFGDPFNRLAGNYNLIWVPFLRGAVSGIDQRSRFIETLADIERTSLDYYATIRSLYRQRRAALIRHEREENLPPKPGFSYLDSPSVPATAVNMAARPAIVPQSVNVSEVPR
ncbi:MAG: VacJ family lipoprotein [Alphaproteobacteria bacterium]|nr:VacJ family lipoprotein [Alphaproteobacteria bacterium]